MEKEITSCFWSCPFAQNSMDGPECGHPYFDDKEPYSRLILDSSGNIPEKCPLRKENLTLTLKK